MAHASLLRMPSTSTRLADGISFDTARGFHLAHGAMHSRPLTQCGVPSRHPPLLILSLTDVRPCERAPPATPIRLLTHASRYDFFSHTCLTHTCLASYVSQAQHSRNPVYPTFGIVSGSLRHPHLLLIHYEFCRLCLPTPFDRRTLLHIVDMEPVHHEHSALFVVVPFGVSSARSGPRALSAPAHGAPASALHGHTLALRHRARRKRLDATPVSTSSYNQLNGDTRRASVPYLGFNMLRLSTRHACPPPASQLTPPTLLHSSTPFDRRTLLHTVDTEPAQHEHSALLNTLVVRLYTRHTPTQNHRGDSVRSSAPTVGAHPRPHGARPVSLASAPTGRANPTSRLATTPYVMCQPPQRMLSGWQKSVSIAACAGAANTVLRRTRCRVAPFVEGREAGLSFGERGGAAADCLSGASCGLRSNDERGVGAESAATGVLLRADFASLGLGVGATVPRWARVQDARRGNASRA
ncbi:hypothetical protein A0H81_08981 [Grifola frondosa]|uniref:Uncharacterized protein n=1 Tax=Grifola frondosa TaxID=5627 RepID=A0A1C7M5B6_GRIFR|nr:hypothetical protein A0H81_08981 [Grifola frondosa]